MHTIRSRLGQPYSFWYKYNTGIHWFPKILCQRLISLSLRHLRNSFECTGSIMKPRLDNLGDSVGMDGIHRVAFFAGPAWCEFLIGAILTPCLVMRLLIAGRILVLGIGSIFRAPRYRQTPQKRIVQALGSVRQCRRHGEQRSICWKTGAHNGRCKFNRGPIHRTWRGYLTWVSRASMSSSHRVLLHVMLVLGSKTKCIRTMQVTHTL